MQALSCHSTSAMETPTQRLKAHCIDADFKNMSETVSLKIVFFIFYSFIVIVWLVDCELVYYTVVHRHSLNG